MRRKLLLAALMIAAAAPAAQAQATRDTGIRTETQERLAQMNEDNGFDWNWLGFIGLLGLLGLRKPHSEDSYHPAQVE